MQPPIYHTPKIWTLPEFLTPAECNELIAQSEAMGYEEAKVSLSSGAVKMPGLRNNYRLIFSDKGLADRYWELVRMAVPEEMDGALAVGLNEQFRFYKYGSGQRFKRHIDGRFRRNEKEESRITFMIYLNEDYEGGETAFDDVTIHPRTGDALLFIHEQKHESIPIRSGVKYVLRSDVMYARE
ncbi:MAG: 2OG-Fe(II) oxygenase [Bacteroidia bacterium]